MSRISVRPEELERLSAQLRQAAEELRAGGVRLDQATDILDWSVRQKDGIDAQSNALREQAVGLASQAETWSQLLASKARLFVETDQALAQQVTRLGQGGAPSAAPGAVAPGDAPQSPPDRTGLADQPVVTAPVGKGQPIDSTNRGWPVDASVTSTYADRQTMTADERQARYAQVLGQFDVTQNPRYLKTEDATYCNIFVTDATRAMGAEIPHWVDDNGAPIPPTPGKNELNANETVQWLQQHGAQHGWRAVTAAEAQAHANDGRPAVAVMYQEPIGHVAMVAPGEYSPQQGPACTNVGARNFSQGTVRQGFGTTDVLYYVHE